MLGGGGGEGRGRRPPCRVGNGAQNDEQNGDAEQKREEGPSGTAGAHGGRGRCLPASKRSAILFRDFLFTATVRPKGRQVFGPPWIRPGRRSPARIARGAVGRCGPRLEAFLSPRKRSPPSLLTHPRSTAPPDPLTASPPHRTCSSPAAYGPPPAPRAPPSLRPASWSSSSALLAWPPRSPAPHPGGGTRLEAARGPRDGPSAP